MEIRLNHLDLLPDPLLERKWGVWFPKGGTGALVEALVRLMKDVGVELKLNQQVSKVIIEGNKARDPS